MISPNPAPAAARRPLLIVFLIVLIDLFGFSIVMPILPLYAAQLHLDYLRIGLVMGAFSLAQLVCAPILGRLSDHHGRRPVLIFSQMGTAVSFLMLAASHWHPAFWFLLAARLLDGASGGNILVAQAYIADVTTPENRSKGMGLIGAAFGIGFFIGPFIGGLLARIAIWAPFAFAAAFSATALSLTFLVLPESLPADPQRRTAARAPTLAAVGQTLRRPLIGLLLLIGFTAVFGFASLEASLSLFLQRRLGFDITQAALAFAYLAFVTAFVQGGLIGRLVKKYGEARLLVGGAGLQVLGFFVMAEVRHWPAFLAAGMIVGVGQSLTSPTVPGLISRNTAPSEQGGTLGVLQSVQTLARFINHVLALSLMSINVALPFREGGVAFVLALCLAVVVLVHPLVRRAGPDADPRTAMPQEPFGPDSTVIEP